ncbi:hypothetical protein PDG61_06615 [Mycolicibacterium sp. BiH015]|uniref:hypothetical protein n=1 Tax=Mycolicibacterium sp. BiH015 TaxID=3018808 RepID=UPI0022DEAC6B|nr:hypothetical protein [Mycolicibacterium sp. BiH015]MDA2890575.1 hypothetical protein [Mycolicibacterium sp. BiH015]
MRTARAISVSLMTLGLAVLPQTPTASADVCGSVGGRHVSVNACGNVADAIAPWVPPPAAYAPLPEDYSAAPPPPPPPPPPPNVSVCANVGRRISVSGCI